jgi:hypothetical protein
MRAILPWIIVGTVAVGVPLIAACGSDEEWHYGPPGGLKGSTFPTATTTSTTTTTTTGTNPPPGMDAGTPPAGDGGAPAGDSGGPPPVAAKFAADIYPMMQPAGTWACSKTGCHNAGGTPPVIDATTATNAYNTLVAYHLLTNNQQYIIPGNTTPSAHGFDCNLKGTCGSGQMPLGAPATAADIAKLETWLASGAPNN